MPIKLSNELSPNPIDQSDAVTAGGTATVDGTTPASSVPNILSSPSDGQTFTQKQETLFQMRYEEQYYVYDLEYVAWLEVNHPEAIPADRYSLITAPTASPLVIAPTVCPSVMMAPTASSSVMAPSTSPLVTAPTAVMAPSTSPLMTAPTASPSLLSVLCTPVTNNPCPHCFAVVYGLF